MKRNKVLFFDADGTLIDNMTKQVPKSAVHVLKKARELGHKVYMNTARVPCLIRQLRDVFKLDGYICGCGTTVYMDDKLIYEHKLELDKANVIKQLLIQHNLECLVEGREALYFSKIPFEHSLTDRIYNVVKQLCDVHVDAIADNSYTFDKFCIQVSEDRHEEEAGGFLAAIDDFEPIYRGRGFYECVPTGCSKASGIDKVLDRLGASYEDTYVFGDSMNDLSMFTSKAEHKILLGEHDKQLEQYATFITKNVLDDGVEYAMKELGIIT